VAFYGGMFGGASKGGEVWVEDKLSHEVAEKVKRTLSSGRFIRSESDNL
jgi:hypothetical protein